MKLQNLLRGLFTACMITTGCSENATGPDETVADLSETEQMSMVASEVAEADGGLMTDLKMASSNSIGSYPALGKSAGFGTTITKNRVTYKLSLGFFNERGLRSNLRNGGWNHQRHVHRRRRTKRHRQKLFVHLQADLQRQQSSDGDLAERQTIHWDYLSIAAYSVYFLYLG